MIKFLGIVAVLVLVWGCSQQQAPMTTGAAPVIGKEAQAQEEASMTQLEDVVDEATLAVSAEIPDMEESAEIIGVVSDEPMSAEQPGLDELNTAVEGAVEELDLPVEDLPVEEDDAMMEEGRRAVEEAIRQSLNAEPMTAAEGSGA